jgi:signal transduction histidine kinase
VVESVKRDATRLAERFGFDVEVEVSGTFERLSSSQRICVVRVVHEALVNVGEHSAATSARVSLSNERGATVVRVVDDGKGFQVEGTLVRAAKRGRLGLVGMSERARLLGGTLDVRSAVGGPTEIRLVLPEWQPLDESASAESDVAAALPDLLADRAARRPHAR